MPGSDYVFLRIAQFFEQLLTRAYPGGPDLYIPARLQAVYLDHLFGQIENFYRCPHVQHKNLPALPNCRALDYQLTGLRDGHKVSGHSRVGDGYRPAHLYLPLEYFHHTSVAAENISEPDYYKSRGG